MSPAPRADAQRNRGRLLDAARDVFTDAGVGAPIVEVARRAGVGVGTVYRHFPTKEALFEAILRQDMERLLAGIRRQAAEAGPGEAFFAAVDVILDEGDRSTGLKDALSGSGLDVGVLLADVTAELRAALGELVGRAQEVGVVRADVGVTEVLAVVAGTFAAMRPHAGDDATATRIRAVMLDGLRPR
jgi:AcrR family transcriptional regulator